MHSLAHQMYVLPYFLDSMSLSNYSSTTSGRNALDKASARHISLPYISGTCHIHAAGEAFSVSVMALVRADFEKLLPGVCGLSEWSHVCNRCTDESTCRQEQLLVAFSQSESTFVAFHSSPLMPIRLFRDLD